MRLITCVAVLAMLVCAVRAEDPRPVVAKATVTETFLGAGDQWAKCRIELQDIHPLFGGMWVRLDGSGQCQVRTVWRGNEKRWSVKLTPEDCIAVRARFLEVDFLSVKIKQRPGVPDEARPRIILKNAEGKTQEQAKWANDKVEGFDRAYSAMSELRTKCEDAEPDYLGPYQAEWKPAEK